MNNKTKNNIMIIVIVILSALTVIGLVLITGFSKSSHGEGSSVVSVLSGASVASDIQEQNSDDSSEPISIPVENSSSAAPNSSSPSDLTGQQIAASASALIGVPFEENGSTPSGFDNSGFIYYVLRENGYITCPRTISEQSRMGARVEYDDLKPGDPVFFRNDGSDEVGFGGIYIGDGKMIACLMPGTEVREVNITNDYYVSNFFGGVSLS